VKEVSESTRSSRESSEDESSVRDTLGSWSRHLDRTERRNSRLDLDRITENLPDHLVLDSRRLGFERRPDPVEENDLLLGSRVLLVDSHNIEESVDGEKLGLRKGRDPGIRDGDGETVGFESSFQTTDGDLGEDSEMSSDFSFEDDTDSDAFSVKDLGGNDGFDGVSDGVPKVDEVSKTCLSLVDGDDVSLDVERSSDDREEKGLFGSSGSDRSSSEVGGGSSRGDGGDNLGGSRLELGEVVLVPDGGGLQPTKEAISSKSCLLKVERNRRIAP